MLWQCWDPCSLTSWTTSQSMTTTCRWPWLLCVFLQLYNLQCQCCIMLSRHLCHARVSTPHHSSCRYCLSESSAKPAVTHQQRPALQTARICCAIFSECSRRVHSQYNAYRKRLTLVAVYTPVLAVVQVSMKWGGRIYNGVINALPDQPTATGRPAVRHTAAGYNDAAAGIPHCSFVLTTNMPVWSSSTGRKKQGACQLQKLLPVLWPRACCISAYSRNGVLKLIKQLLGLHEGPVHAMLY